MAAGEVLRALLSFTGFCVNACSNRAIIMYPSVHEYLPCVYFQVNFYRLFSKENFSLFVFLKEMKKNKNKSSKWKHKLNEWMKKTMESSRL